MASSFQSCKETVSGASMKVWMKRFTNIFGTIKPILCVGFDVSLLFVLIIVVDLYCS